MRASQNDREYQVKRAKILSGKTPWYVRLALKVARRRPRDVQVVSDRFVPEPYLVRYTILNLGCVKVYLHHFLRKDHETRLHDHPWPFFHYVLWGGYLESNQEGVHDRARGYWAIRGPRYRHSIIELSDLKAWTLVIRGPTVRDWGFHCKDGYVIHTDYKRRQALGLGWEC